MADVKQWDVFPTKIFESQFKTTEEIKKYINKAKSKSEFERMSITKEKTGVDTGLKVLNPINNKSVPLWVADYVLINYGTGAIMAVPGHDERDYEFAKKYDLEIIQVIIDKDHSIDILENPYIDCCANQKGIKNLILRNILKEYPSTYKN